RRSEANVSVPVSGQPGSRRSTPRSDGRSLTSLGARRTASDVARQDLKWALTAAVVFVVWLIGDKLAPRGLPVGIILQGLVFGSLYALIAMGLVLIFRANRVVNFAQAELGAVASVLAVELVVKYNVNY